MAMQNWTVRPVGFVRSPFGEAREVPHGLGAKHEEVGFLEILPDDLRYAFEFRHATWLVDAVYQLLERRNISLCVAESEKFEVPEVITADFVYYRLRKPDYTAADIDAIAARAQELLRQDKDLFLMFKHEETPEGALHAEEVLRKVRGET